MSTAKPNADTPENWDRSGLPAWTYFNEELHEIEKDLLFRRHWQLACHQSDVPEPGSYQCLDMVGERALILRGKDGTLRAFHNLCRHRGARVVADQSGHCKHALTCPFHGWSYALDGRLNAPLRPASLPDLDPEAYGLKPIEMEIWQGFVFIRFLKGAQPSVAQIMARHLEEAAPYDLENMAPSHDRIWHHSLKANWKSVRDVDNEGYHVPMAHPSLQDLYGKAYHDESYVEGSNRSFGAFNDGLGRLWSVRNYKKILPQMPKLPEQSQKGWLYLGLFPNTVIGIYPDSAIFYQEYPLSPSKTIQRGGAYRYREESRELRLARYLSSRIDRTTQNEDDQLIEWSWEAMQSSGYDDIILSDLEYGVRSHHDKLRDLIPAMTLAEEPESVAAANAALLTARQKPAAE